MSFKGVELFAGGGGLLLGSALAGVEHVIAAEWNRWACGTLRENTESGYPLVEGLRTIEGDIRDIDWLSELGDTTIDIVSGGPPCQPFSLGGLARNADDPRDMFPATAAVIDELRPKAFVIENVKGLTRASFTDYFEYITLRLAHPSLTAKAGETWREHAARLQREHTSVKTDLQYNVVTTLVNAADYGVPQHRHRVFFVGFRADIAADWAFPQATHSGGALALSQHTGAYWEKHNVPEHERILVRRKPVDDGLLPWVTVREALAGMPPPGVEGTPGWLDHVYERGARAYRGHTGSPLDQPSKALKAGDHGVPGGENMIAYPDGSLRHYTVREAARIQTFPDRYALHGTWSEALRQLGNAVPVRLAETVMSSVVEHLAIDAART